MSVNSTILKALEPLGYDVAQDEYKGTKNEYITFNIAADSGDNFADDAPEVNIIEIQVHFFLPMGVNYLKKKKEIRNALFHAGFTYPVITELIEDNKIRHLAFECQYEEEREE